jgi:SPP1 gp7 family putative phage head morphogenesis protein
VKGRFDVTKSHADLIARDQVTKLNADMTRMRHKAAGIKRFRWSTSRDERVRESHAALDGEEFSYDDLPEVDGEKVMPGEPVCCRCVAIAIVDWLEDE